MRRGHTDGRALGMLLIAAGCLILFAMVLPSGFWWFLLSAALICLGLRLCNGR